MLKESIFDYYNTSFRLTSGINDNFIIYGFHGENCKELLDGFPELLGLGGVYVIYGTNSKGEKKSYVGQSRTNIMSRILDHKKKKDFFNYGYIISAKNNGFSPKQIDSLEQMYIYYLSRSIYKITNKVSAPKSDKAFGFPNDLVKFSEKVNNVISILNFELLNFNLSYREINPNIEKKIIVVDDFDLDFEDYDRLEPDDSVSHNFTYQGLNYEIIYDKADPENIVFILKLSNKYTAFMYKIDDISFYGNEEGTLDLHLPDGNRMFGVDVSVGFFFVDNKLVDDPYEKSRLNSIIYKISNS